MPTATESQAAPAPPRGPARIEYLKVESYRALRRVELKHLTPLTVLLGPNGSGKSTLFDVFNFLSECFQHGLRHAGTGAGGLVSSRLADKTALWWSRSSTASRRGAA